MGNIYRVTFNHPTADTLSVGGHLFEKGKPEYFNSPYDMPLPLSKLGNIRALTIDRIAEDEVDVDEVDFKEVENLDDLRKVGVLYPGPSNVVNTPVGKFEKGVARFDIEIEKIEAIFKNNPSFKIVGG